MKQDFPIACLLTDKELQVRRKTVLEKVGRFLLEVEELENGFKYNFPMKDFLLEDLLTVIKLERKCCPFLSFKLILENQSEELSLELTGKTGAKEAVKMLFDWNQ